MKWLKTVASVWRGRRPGATEAKDGSAPGARTNSHRSKRVEPGREQTAPAKSSNPSWPPAEGPADALIMGTVIALVAFGVVMVYSASAVLAYKADDGGQHYLIRQAAFAGVCLPLTLVLARFDYHRIRPLTYFLLGGSALMVLATVTVFADPTRGSTRWISFGSINVQPSEIAKLAMICWLAYSLSKKSQQIKTFSIGFLPHILVAAILMFLCLKQPDFGAAAMIGMITFVMLFAAGAKLAYMLGAVILVAPIVYHLIASSPYRMARIIAFLAPFEHRHDEGYQIAESLLSFGAGGVTGVGLGDSRQKLFFLPEAHTDFIASIIAEELGFIGIALLVLTFVVLVYRGLRAAFSAPDDYGTYLAAGITLFIGMQAFTNLAVAVALVPTKGLSLPFISHGGSSLLTNCAAVGMLLNVSRPRAVLPGDRKKPVASQGAWVRGASGAGVS